MSAALLVLALLASGARGEGTSAAFLGLGLGARPAAMGGAFTAAADDVNALAWNPSGLAQVGERQASLTHAELFAGTRLDAMHVVQPASFGTFALGVTYLSHETVEARGASGEAAGGFSAYDMATQLAFGTSLGAGVRLGLGVKHIQSRIADATAQAWALDLGSQLRTPVRGLTLGLSARNLGRGLAYVEERSSLPSSVALGASQRLGTGVLLALDVRHHPGEGRYSIVFGTEYALVPALRLRAGYLAGMAGKGVGPNPSQPAGLGAGVGVSLKRFDVDYALSPAGEAGSVQRVSIGARF